MKKRKNNFSFQRSQLIDSGDYILTPMIPIFDLTTQMIPLTVDV